MFENDGTLLQILYHDQFRPDYCQRSSILIREWVDPNDPDVKFKYLINDDGKEEVDDVTFVNCRGHRVSIDEAIKLGHKEITIHKPSKVTTEELQKLRAKKKQNQPKRANNQRGQSN